MSTPTATTPRRLTPIEFETVFHTQANAA